jgi:tripartite-type tricarboxylate transporter receptor subunit TctC
MMTRKSVLRRCTLVLATLLAGAAPALAQDARSPIRLIVSVAAGGVTDSMGRLMAREMSGTLGRAVVVENRGGANGILGAGIVARAAPDGLTACFCHSGPIALAPLTQTDMPFSPERDLTPVTRVYDLDNFFVVRPEVAGSLAEFVRRARSEPGRFNFGSTGTGGAQHLGGEMFRQAAGLDLIHVPYPGEAPMLIDFLGGRIDLAILSALAAANIVADGRARVLAVTGARRAATFPDVPTVAEQGYPGFQFGTWTGLFLPGSTPAPIVDRLYAAAAAALAKPEVLATMRAAGASPVVGLSPTAFATYLQEEAARWRGVSAALAASTRR